MAPENRSAFEQADVRLLWISQALEKQHDGVEPSLRTLGAEATKWVARCYAFLQAPRYWELASVLIACVHLESLSVARVSPGPKRRMGPSVGLSSDGAQRNETTMLQQSIIVAWWWW